MAKELTDTQCSKLLKAVADRERLRIIQSLRGGPKAVGDLAGELELPIQNTSHHLKLLRKSGLVTTSRKGRFIIYSLAPKYAGQRLRHPLNVLDFGCCRIEFGQQPRSR